MAHRIYRMDQKIEVKVDDIYLYVTPLSFGAKAEAQADLVKAQKGDMGAAMKAVVNCIKKCLKEVKGFEVENEEGQIVPYELRFTENKELTDECVDEILNLPISSKISTICTNFLGGIPDKILDNEGKPLEGVSILKKKETKLKK